MQLIIKKCFNKTRRTLIKLQCFAENITMFYNIYFLKIKLHIFYSKLRVSLEFSTKFILSHFLTLKRKCEISYTISNYRAVCEIFNFQNFTMENKLKQNF